MSDPKQPEEKTEAEAEAKPEDGDAMGEEQLEAVSGGILIGLNQATLASKDLLAHKDIPTLDATLATDVTLKQQDTAWKYLKK